MLTYGLNYPDFNKTRFIEMSSLYSGKVGLLSSAQNLACLPFCVCVSVV
jgi:hypothetical protein